MLILLARPGFVIYYIPLLIGNCCCQGGIPEKRKQWISVSLQSDYIFTYNMLVCIKFQNCFEPQPLELVFISFYLSLKISGMNINFTDDESITINYQEWFVHSAPSSRRPCWGLLERRCPSKDDYRSRFDYGPFFMIFIQQLLSQNL